jgi:hypothetical protein
LEDRDTKSETKSPLIARLIRIANYEDDNYYKIVDYFNDPKIQIDLFQFGSTRDPQEQQDRIKLLADMVNPESSKDEVLLKLKAIESQY